MHATGTAKTSAAMLAIGTKQLHLRGHAETTLELSPWFCAVLKGIEDAKSRGKKPDELHVRRPCVMSAFCIRDAAESIT